MDKDRIRHVSLLARIALSPEEEERLGKDFETMLDYVSQLERADISGVEPTYHVLPLTNVSRDDVVEPPLSAEEALRNAPARIGGSFRVPKVL